jgi:hypothetical protein
MTTTQGDVHVRTVAQLEALASQLSAFNGHRTLWIDDASREVVHTEPEVELEAHGYRYVATVLGPSPDALAQILADRLFALAAA